MTVIDRRAPSNMDKVSWCVSSRGNDPVLILRPGTPTERGRSSQSGGEYRTRMMLPRPAGQSAKSSSSWSLSRRVSGHHAPSGSSSVEDRPQGEPAGGPWGRGVRGHEPPPSMAAAVKLSRPAGPGSGALESDLTLAVGSAYSWWPGPLRCGERGQAWGGDAQSFSRRAWSRAVRWALPSRST